MNNYKIPMFSKELVNFKYNGIDNVNTKQKREYYTDKIFEKDYPNVKVVIYKHYGAFNNKTDYYRIKFNDNYDIALLSRNQAVQIYEYIEKGHLYMNNILKHLWSIKNEFIQKLNKIKSQPYITSF
jgi:hypothetical protein